MIERIFRTFVIPRIKFSILRITPPYLIKTQVKIVLAGCILLDEKNQIDFLTLIWKPDQTGSSTNRTRNQEGHWSKCIGKTRAQKTGKELANRPNWPNSNGWAIVVFKRKRVVSHCWATSTQREWKLHLFTSLHTHFPAKWESEKEERNRTPNIRNKVRRDWWMDG